MSIAELHDHLGGLITDNIGAQQATRIGFGKPLPGR